MIQMVYACGIPVYVGASPSVHASTQKPYFDCFNLFFFSTYFLIQLPF